MTNIIQCLQTLIEETTVGFSDQNLAKIATTIETMNPGNDGDQLKLWTHRIKDGNGLFSGKTIN